VKRWRRQLTLWAALAAPLLTGGGLTELLFLDSPGVKALLARPAPPERPGTSSPSASALMPGERARDGRSSGARRSTSPSSASSGTSARSAQRTPLASPFGTDRSPEARYPVAIEQAYATARWIIERGASEGLDASRLAVAGDSVGGNMTAALAILAKQRGDVTFVHQSLYYPVTDAAQDTASYREFADGPYLTARAMAWFWDAYTPDPGQRAEITASPLRASLEELAGLPLAFVVADENDVLRDEGEAYARRLTQAGVPTTSVRYNGTLHDFMMLNPVRATRATSAAVEQAIRVLRGALGTG
jgi:hypothetical protein